MEVKFNWKKLQKGQNRKEAEEVRSEQWKNFLDPERKKKKKRIKDEQPKVTSMTTRATFLLYYSSSSSFWQNIKTRTPHLFGAGKTKRKERAKKKKLNRYATAPCRSSSCVSHQPTTAATDNDDDQEIVIGLLGWISTAALFFSFLLGTVFQQNQPPWIP